MTFPERMARGGFRLVLVLPVPAAMLLVAMERPRAAIVVLAIASLVIPTWAAVVERWAPCAEPGFWTQPEGLLLGVLGIGIAWAWFPGLLVLALFGICLPLVIRGGRPQLRLVVAFAAALIAMRFSGGGAHGDRGLLDGGSALQALLVLPPYLAIVGKERIVERWRMVLLLCAVALAPHALLFHLEGANTPWLTRHIEGQSGAYLLRKPDRLMVAPRAVIPALYGLLVQDREGRWFSLDEEGRVFCSTTKKFGRTTGASCDLDAPGLCYMPWAGSGLAAMDPLSCAPRLVPIASELPYTQLVLAPGGSPWGLLRDDGSSVVPIRRNDSGGLEGQPIVGLRRAINNWTWSTVHVDDQGPLVFAQTHAGRLQVHALEGAELRLLLKTDAGYLPDPADAIALARKQIVYAAQRGTSYVFDWDGSQLHEFEFSLGFRKLICDEKRELCYVLDEFGFLTFIDLHSQQVRQKFVLGFFVSDLHFDGDDIYFASSAGIFRIDIDEAMETSADGRSF